MFKYCHKEAITEFIIDLEQHQKKKTMSYNFKILYLEI